MKATNLVAAICNPNEATEEPIKVTKPRAEYNPNSDGLSKRSNSARNSVLRELLTIFWIVSDLMPETIFFVFSEATATL